MSSPRAETTPLIAKSPALKRADSKKTTSEKQHSEMNQSLLFQPCPHDHLTNANSDTIEDQEQLASSTSSTSSISTAQRNSIKNLARRRSMLLLQAHQEFLKEIINLAPNNSDDESIITAKKSVEEIIKEENLQDMDIFIQNLSKLNELAKGIKETQDRSQIKDHLSNNLVDAMEKISKACVAVTKKDEFKINFDLKSEIAALDPNNKHAGIRNIVALAKNPQAEYSSIITECQNRTKCTSSIGGFFRNLIFPKINLIRSDAADLVYRAIAEVNQNYKMFSQISTLEELLIAQQKRDAIRMMQYEIIRLRAPFVKRYGGPSVEEVDSDVKNKIMAYNQLITELQTSSSQQSFKHVLSQSLNIQINGKTIHKILNKSRGWTKATSQQCIEDLLNLPEPKHLLIQLSLSKATTKQLQINLPASLPFMSPDM